MSNLKEQAKQLWKECFADSDAFIDLYFSKRYRDDITDVAEEDGRVVAVLQRIPYPLTYGGKLIPTAYVSGACTHADFRNRGIMHRLLMQAHRRMYADGKLLSTLIPAEEWLKGYYARSGYAGCFQQAVENKVGFEQSVDNPLLSLEFSRIDLDKPVEESLYAFFNAQLMKRDCCIQHTFEDFRVILADLHLSAGSLWVACRKEGYAALAFCLPVDEEGTLRVEELVAADKVCADALSAHLMQVYRPRRMECRIRQGGTVSDLGMVRVIRAEHMLRLYARLHPDYVGVIEVEGDEALPQNNGCYRIEGGCCQRLAAPEASPLTLDVRRLAFFLFEGKHPYMSLMLN